MLTDWYELPVSTASPTARDAYVEGCQAKLTMYPGAVEAFDRAIAADPAFALAHAAKAHLLLERGDTAAARATMDAATSRAAGLSPRETSHIAFFGRLVAGDGAAALAALPAHLDAWPRDALIFSLPPGAYGLFAFSGMRDHDRARADLCERHARHFDAEDWWFLTYRGWSQVENGNVTLGRALTERGHALRIENAHGTHALLHAMYEGGAGEESEKLVADWLPRYGRSGILHGHIAWHAALGALGRGDAERALALYSEHIQPSVSAAPPLMVVTDTGSFLWRLQAYGHRVPPGLWQGAASYSAGVFQKPGFAFADVHMALIAAATGDKAAVEQRAAALAGLVEAGTLPAGPVVPAICRAALAFAAEDYGECARLLEPVAGEVVRIGGSGAQREMVEDMLLLSWMRGGAAAKARKLLDRRLHRRPSPRDTRWLGLLAA